MACCCAFNRFRATLLKFPKGRYTRQTENNRRAKYYTLTAAGRRRLREETAGWNRLATAIASALNTTPEEV
jgi:DNA-binding PadR family transcriptional regulator